MDKLSIASAAMSLYKKNSNRKYIEEYLRSKGFNLKASVEITDAIIKNNSTLLHLVLSKYNLEQK